MAEQKKEKTVRPESFVNEPVKEEEVKEFLKFLKHSEYMRAFNGIERRVMGRIEIPLLIGLTAYEVDFLVMDIKPSYNCLLGKPWIHTAGAVPSSLHQKLKLVSEGKGALPRKGLGSNLHGRVEAPILKDKNDRFGLGRFSDINDISNVATELELSFEEDMCLEGSQDFEDDRNYDLSLDLLRMVKQKEKQILPNEETVKIVTLEEGKVVKIGTYITEETKRDLVELLQEFKDIFAWSYQDMLGLSTTIVVHCFSIKENYSPKDNFSLHHIDTLVDNTVGYSLFSLIDGFSGYNQIKMHPEDMEKTTFITLWGTFCYKVMSFGLKNIRATYQRAMVTLFHDMMHKEIELYVDDMIAKSRTKMEHIQVLRKIFLRLRKFQVKLNPTKCTFGARSGKLLGFVVSKRGIEIDSDKVRAIQELPPPHT
ncbi:RNA-directed DNA polymerase (Reverse transcriptase), Ribonuclease H [Gossypium australe]|uniref:RNA-directed DNA polymerase (Reverse transcriptase), Ribonuclease H n=1 Tax=Gossypium australe TaxID=47621 RepID=A0A5B6V8L5_9ROSI|nr:RNA-directed DNA polymerase (Reverse transcriptase), Ribonuclease H [Gossypium australe]